MPSPTCILQRGTPFFFFLVVVAVVVFRMCIVCVIDFIYFFPLLVLIWRCVCVFVFVWHSSFFFFFFVIPLSLFVFSLCLLFCFCFVFIVTEVNEKKISDAAAMRNEREMRWHTMHKLGIEICV